MPFEAGRRVGVYEIVGSLGSLASARSCRAGRCPADSPTAGSLSLRRRSDRRRSVSVSRILPFGGSRSWRWHQGQRRGLERLRIEQRIEDARKICWRRLDVLADQVLHAEVTPSEHAHGNALVG